MGALTKKQQELCVKLRVKGIKIEDILEEFRMKFGFEPALSKIQEILKENGLTKERKITFTQEMIDYLKANYKRRTDVHNIAQHLGLEEVQVRNKADYLGLDNPKEKPIDQNLIDAKNNDKRIEALKKNITLESKVKVKYRAYNKDADMIETVQTAPVVGIYSSHIGVIIRGHRVSYYWDEILQLLKK